MTPQQNISISEVIANWAPSVLGTVIAVEQGAHALPGATKQQIVVNSVLAGAQAAGSVPNGTVQAIAGLAALFVGILNHTGLFNHGASPNTNPATALAAQAPKVAE